MIALRRLGILLAPWAAACSGQIAEEGTPGCLAGNRSQCVTQAALGDRFGCARMHDRTVWCWGANDESQLGYPTVDLCPVALPDGMTRSIACHTYPFQVPGIADVSLVAAGDRFACALRGDKTVVCWGANEAGQLGAAGAASSVKAIAVPGLAGVSALALGARHACAISDGSVWCWGADDAGQLGVDHPSQLCAAGGAPIPCETVPRAVAGLASIVAIAAGAAHTCAVNGDGAVWCWGANDFGQLGAGTPGNVPSAKPLAVRAHGLTRFARSVAAGAYHSCTVRDDGAVFCWGRDDHGELGVAPAMPPPEGCAGPCSPVPVLVADLPGAPKLPDLPPPTVDGGAPPDLADAPDLATPPDLAAPPTDDGGPDLASGPDLAAVPVGPTTAPPKAITAAGSHGCALLGDGTARCWGGDASGEVGDGMRGDAPRSPSVVIAQPGAAPDNPLAGATRIVAGAATTCALLVDGSLRCWGTSEAGALGDGDLAPRAGPVPVAW